MQDTLENIGIIVAVIVGIISGVIYIYRTVKSTNHQVDEDTIKTYKDNVEALTKRIEILEESNRNALAQLNQLKGENKALRDTLNLRDPDLITKISDGFGEISNMKELIRVQTEESFRMRKDIECIKDFCENNAKPILKQVIDDHNILKKGLK